jgi:hypothetical protein
MVARRRVGNRVAHLTLEALPRRLIRHAGRISDVCPAVDSLVCALRRSTRAEVDQILGDDAVGLRF